MYASVTHCFKLVLPPNHDLLHGKPKASLDDPFDLSYDLSNTLVHLKPTINQTKCEQICFYIVPITAPCDTPCSFYKHLEMKCHCKKRFEPI